MVSTGTFMRTQACRIDRTEAPNANAAPRDGVRRMNGRQTGRGSSYRRAWTSLHGTRRTARIYTDAGPYATVSRDARTR